MRRNADDMAVLAMLWADAGFLTLRGLVYATISILIAQATCAVYMGYRINV